MSEPQLELPEMPEAPSAHPVSSLSDIQFWRAWNRYHGLRRGAELIGICILWRVWGIAPMFGLMRLSDVARKLEAEGFQSKSAMYRAVDDLRSFLDHYEPLSEGVPLEELINRVSTQNVSVGDSLIGDSVVESA